MPSGLTKNRLALLPPPFDKAALLTLVEMRPSIRDAASPVTRTTISLTPGSINTAALGSCAGKPLAAMPSAEREKDDRLCSRVSPEDVNVPPVIVQAPDAQGSRSEPLTSVPKLPSEVTCAIAAPAFHTPTDNPALTKALIF